MQFRVVATPGAAHVKKEFDYHSGLLTPEMVVDLENVYQMAGVY